MQLGMVVGFDVCHDPRDKRKSFGAMVSSIDGTLGRYYSTISLHASGDELSSSFSINITSKQFYLYLNSIPLIALVLILFLNV